MKYKLALLLFTLLAIMPLVAQTDACPALVEQALQAIGNNCANLDRNFACYGYPRVEASFDEVQPVGYFTVPADRAALNTVKTIRTAPADVATQNWGVAVMKLQANLPDTLPGEAVTFVLMGDAALTNMVSPGQATAPVQPVSFTALTAADLRSEPGLTSNVVGTAQSGAALLADGLSTDRQWVRVLSGNIVGWMNVGLLSSRDGLNTLPVIEAERLSPMQAFYFTSGIAKPACTQAPSALAIQSPEGLTVDLSVNGADISIGSFVTLQTGENSTAVLTVHDGHVIIDGDREINSGETVIANLDAEGSISIWGDARPASPDELEIGDAAQLAVQAAVPSTDTITVDSDSPLYHIVQPGENLFRIALRYNTSVLDIAQANGLSDIQQIYVGQRLLIPNPGSGFVNAPDAGAGNIPNVTEPVQPVLVNGVDCSRFVGTSPIGRLPYGAITFYWDAAPGTTQYVLNFYTDTGILIMFRMTKGDETNISLDSAELGGGRNFLWDVQAIRDGQLACITPRVAVLRDEAPPPSLSQPVCPTSAAC